MKIAANKLVSLQYELYIDSEGKPELVEKTTPSHPLTFIYGAGMMLPKFEEHLFGLQKGDSFEFTLAAADAYGDYREENVLKLARENFETDGKLDKTVIFEGNIVPLTDSEGNRYQADIVEISDSHITVDLNHPFAGDDLHFKGAILDVHEPSSDELNAMLGGCNCGDDCHDHCDCHSCQ